MLYKRFSLLAMLGALLISHTSHAHSVDGLVPMLGLTAVQPTIGWFAGAEIGKSSSSHSLSDATVTVTGLGTFMPASGKVEDENPAYRFLIGYLFHPYFALECGVGEQSRVEFKNVDYDATVGGDPVIAPRLTIDKVVLDAFAKVLLPLSDQISFYAKVGAAHIRADVDDSLTLTGVGTAKILGGDVNKTVLTYGIGGEVTVRQDVVLYINWVRTEQSGILEETDTTTVGIAYYYG